MAEEDQIAYFTELCRCRIPHRALEQQLVERFDIGRCRILNRRCQIDCWDFYFRRQLGNDRLHRQSNKRTCGQGRARRGAGDNYLRQEVKLLQNTYACEKHHGENAEEDPLPLMDSLDGHNKPCDESDITLHIVLLINTLLYQVCQVLPLDIKSTLWYV